MSNENYKSLSDKLDAFRKDVDDKMVTKVDVDCGGNHPVDRHQHCFPFRKPGGME